MKKQKGLIWPPSFSKTNPAASNAVCALRGARPAPLPWSSIIANLPFSEGTKNEERDFTTHFRFGRVAFDLPNRNTRYRSETIHVHLQQLLPPHLPGKDQASWPSIHLHVLPGRYFLSPFCHPHHHRHPLDVPLYAFHRESLF